jgi:elongator complex protein 3
MQVDAWRAKHAQPLPPEDEAQLLRLIQAVSDLPECGPEDLTRLLRQYPRAHGGQFAKDKLVAAFRRFCQAGKLTFSHQTLQRLQMKPTRTQSGVATVTVLTKPWPCPGECIFCPTDEQMPKSYLSDEPGALRAAQSQFDPYATTAGRLRALENIGHPTDKVELLVLGGTWSCYPADYQAWYIQRCFDALNGAASASLAQAQQLNEGAAHRNVGLVIETRPDFVNPAEVQRLRGYGVTKVQLGAQSLNDEILALNQRGHTVEQTRAAVGLLRAAGFKIHLHWMPNLLGATPQSDLADYEKLWSDPGLRPDELKIYPCVLTRESELMRWWERGEYRPYSDDELVWLLAECKARTPRYVRLNRIARDFPAGHVAAGSLMSNLREVAQRRLAEQGRRCECIRCREVKGERVLSARLAAPVEYDTAGGREIFLSAETSTHKLAGFLRLSLPTPEAALSTGLEELRGAALIREVHVYGPVVRLGDEAARGEAQHLGLGAELIRSAEQRSREAGYPRLAVISAIGTREYYRKQSFDLGELYMAKSL